jgi:DNA-binding MarR family transcriptional regulator
MAQYEDCIVFLLAKANQRAHGILKRRLHSHGLTPVQHLILEALWDEEGLSAGEIGKRLVLDTATLSGVLDRMAEAGWILKRTDRDDRRVLRLYLSNKAKGAQQSLIEERTRANEEILDGMRLEEKVLLKRLLRDVRG